MNPQSLPDPIPVKKNKVPVFFWIVTVLFLLLVAAGGYLFATKQLVFVFGAANQDVVTVISRTCSKVTIKLFNDAYSATTGEQRAASLKNAYEAVNKTSGYAGDPNCIYIRYTYYFELKDMTNAQKEVDTLNTLAKKNLYVTNELIGVRPIESMQTDINTSKTPAGQTQGDVGSGGRG